MKLNNTWKFINMFILFVLAAVKIFFLYSVPLPPTHLKKKKNTYIQYNIYSIYIHIPEGCRPNLGPMAHLGISFIERCKYNTIHQGGWEGGGRESYSVHYGGGYLTAKV